MEKFCEKCVIACDCKLRDQVENCSIFKGRPCYEREGAECIKDACINYDTERCPLSRKQMNDWKESAEKLLQECPANESGIAWKDCPFTDSRHLRITNWLKWCKELSSIKRESIIKKHEKCPLKKGKE